VASFSSFPTRRSSDLEARVVAELEVEERAHGRLAVGEPNRGLELPALEARIEELRDVLPAAVGASALVDRALVAVLQVPDRHARSEEHTSELQSPDHL